MGKKLYLECNAGISGDMMVAALLDLGADWEKLNRVINSLDAHGFRISKSRVNKSGIDCMDFNVILDAEHENHDHDMEYLFGHSAGEGEHTSNHHESNYHASNHHESNYHASNHHESNHHESNHHTTNHHEHRNLKKVCEIIDSASATEKAKNLAKNIFNIVAKAESKAHNKPVDEVHFHEVGAIDSIVDILAAAVCLDDLDIGEVYVPYLCEGQGTVRCQHGILPIPVPATSNIVAAHDINMKFTGVKGELVTPTGAAIVAAVRTSDKLPNNFKIKKIGIGAGKRNYEIPSMLRAMIIEETVDFKEVYDCKKSESYKKEDSCEENYIYKLESNIDDCSGEVLGFLMEKLFEEGARDVYYFPVFMKKNRPGIQINVICMPEDVSKLEEIIFFNTTTIGIRRQKMERSVLPREIIEIDTYFGKAKVKVCTLENSKRFYPEYESVVKICREKNLAYMDVYNEIVNACR